MNARRLTHSALDDLLKRFHSHDQSALAKLITVIEDDREDVLADKEYIISRLPKKKNTIRIAVSGPPGVGKSTFINLFGQKIIGENLKLSVLPIDPSSDISKGSMLADKTRMVDLLRNDNVFIRPSPSQGMLGGVAYATSDVLFLVEAFGFDVVVMETVGVGQSESLAYSLCDHFIILMQPGAGDELQAMKKGMLEYGDFIVVNKADGQYKDLAQKTVASLKALNLAKKAKVISISSLEDVGISELTKEIFLRHTDLTSSGELASLRHKKLNKLMTFLFDQELLCTLKRLPPVRSCYEELKRDLAQNEMPLRFKIYQALKNLKPFS